MIGCFLIVLMYRIVICGWLISGVLKRLLKMFGLVIVKVLFCIFFGLSCLV